MIGMMLVVFLVLLMLGIPVCFSLAIPTLIYFLMNTGSVPVEFIAHQTTNPLTNYVLIALPAFLLSGRMMNGTGVTHRIFDLANALVGRFRGGLVYTNIVASMMFASMSGTAVGDAGGLGQLEMEMMDRAGYERKVSAGVTAASSVLGPIIPPSILMVLIGYSTGASVGQLFLGGAIPGVMIGVALMVYSYIHASRGGDAYIQTTKFDPKEVRRTMFSALPGLGLPIIIIGGIISGIFSATEAAAVAVVYGFLVGMFIYKEITLKDLPGIFVKSAQTAAGIMIITGCAYIFAWFITAKQLPQLLIQVMNTFITSKTAFLIFLNIALFLVGMFMESFSAIIVLMPILFPVATAYGIDPIHFGVIVCINLAIGYVTPPYGATLFVACGLTGKSVREVFPFVIPTILAMLVVLIIVTYFPQTYLWLPQLMG